MVSAFEPLRSSWMTTFPFVAVERDKQAIRWADDCFVNLKMDECLIKIKAKLKVNDVFGSNKGEGEEIRNVDKSQGLEPSVVTELCKECHRVCINVSTLVIHADHWICNANRYRRINNSTLASELSVGLVQQFIRVGRSWG